MVKIKEFQQILRKKKIDFFIAVNIDFERIDYDTVYFSGYNGVGALIIPSKKKNGQMTKFDHSNPPSPRLPLLHHAGSG